MNKREIIIDYGKREFSEYLTNDISGEVVKLFDDEGCELLKQSGKITERISYILTYSKFSDELFKNEKFVDLFLSSNVYDYYAVLRDLKDETYEIIIDRCLQNPEYSDKFTKLISYFNNDFILKAVKNWKYPIDGLYTLLNTGSNPLIHNIILENDNIDLSDERARFDILIEHIRQNNFHAFNNNVFHEKSSIDEVIPRHKLNNKLYKALWERYDIFELRDIVNKCDYVFDTDDFNNFIRRKEDEEINNYLNNGLFSKYKSLYESCKVMDSFDTLDRKPSELEINDYEMSKKKYYSIVREDERLYNEVRMFMRKHNLDGLHEFLTKESDKMISNYIIDYHFKENYYNTTIDLKELLNFYYAGNVNLSMDKVSLYDRLLNIDYLSFEDKLELHNELKNTDVMGMFYDDMAYSRNIVGQMLRDNSLAKESLQEYRDEELSTEYGVDVYKIDDNPFFAIIKNGRMNPEELPAGHSFSLIGCGGIGSFGNIKDSNTFLYDASELNPEQVVHTFPFDSFTLYKPFQYDGKASTRVNTLLTPEELMHQTSLASQYMYNELLLLEKGSIKTDMDSSIPTLQKIALYCLDEIREQDVKVAQENGVGIFLVDSKNFNKGIEMPKRIYRHDVNMWDENYYSKMDKKEFEEKRNM